MTSLDELRVSDSLFLLARSVGSVIKFLTRVVVAVLEARSGVVQRRLRDGSEKASSPKQAGFK